MTRMTQNGISTTQAGQEQYETFYSAHRGRKVTRVMYDYRTKDGELFSVVAPTLKSVVTSVTSGSPNETSNHSHISDECGEA